MKANMMVLVCFVLFWVWTPVDSQKISGIFPPQNDTLQIPMDMADNSVDDMYFNCRDRMKTIALKYFKKEKKNKAFNGTWGKAERCANKKQKDGGLMKHHIQAICVYTSGYGRFYNTFNKAVRTSRAEYGKSFQYHSLHFWLTEAVQILKKKCHLTYRRSKDKFIGEVNDIIRFGCFTSTSKLANLTHFGDKTCFQIKTCEGAYLENYPENGDYEQEVLIPPYEMFKITQKHVNMKEQDDCETLYVLETAGFTSHLNCNLVNGINENTLNFTDSS